MENIATYVSIAAGVCTGVSLVPQLIKLIKQKKAEEMSFLWAFILLAGLGGWAWYGILKEDYAIIFTNTFSFIINLLIIGFSIYYKKPHGAL